MYCNFRGSVNERNCLKLSRAENVLREWFEAGIAFNLIFGPLHFRKESGLVHLRKCLAKNPFSPQALSTMTY